MDFPFNERNIEQKAYPRRVNIPLYFNLRTPYWLWAKLANRGPELTIFLMTLLKMLRPIRCFIGGNILVRNRSVSVQSKQYICYVLCYSLWLKIDLYKRELYDICLLTSFFYICVPFLWKWSKKKWYGGRKSMMSIIWNCCKWLQ